MKTYRAIGLMSGTSLDGIDAAIIRTDGETFIESEAFITEPYEETFREKIRRCFNFPSKHIALAQEVEKELTQMHGDIVLRLLERQGLSSRDIDVIGFHGQTISHAPEKKYTCQLGNGVMLASMTHIPVVNDFREMDVRAGGQGAPLVPVYHQALANNLEKPVAFLNLGGVANVTFVGYQGALSAFDTGPGNALIDDWMLRKTGQKCDMNGETAAKGRVHDDILTALMAHDYFKLPPPKSIDRNMFLSDAWKHLSIEDGAATLTSFTASAVAQAVQHLPEKPKQWIVSGGGRLNKTLIAELVKALAVPVRLIDDIGHNGDAIEAEAFGYLAVRSMRGLPISFPETTGVPYPMQGGTFHHAANS